MVCVQLDAAGNFISETCDRAVRLDGPEANWVMDVPSEPAIAAPNRARLKRQFSELGRGRLSVWVPTAGPVRQKAKGVLCLPCDPRQTASELDF